VSVTRVVVLDSMAVDPFLDDPVAFALAVSATAAGRLRMLSTHVTSDEVARIQHNPERRAGLLRVLDELTQQVPTSGFILDVSRLDEAMLNDDVQTFQVLRSPAGASTADTTWPSKRQLKSLTFCSKRSATDNTQSVRVAITARTQGSSTGTRTTRGARG